MSFKPLLLLLLPLILLFSQTAQAYEEVLPRYALIIGNADYKFAPLKNPVNDATDMAATLRKLRYTTTIALNQNPEQLRNSIKQFYASIKESNAISLLYYAGHAIQAEAVNYLIPVNAGITSYKKMKSASLSLNEVFAEIRQSPGKQNILILDACRNNPFKPPAGSNSRSIHIKDRKLLNISSGLAPVEAPTGTLIAYATEPGNTASDGEDNNGTYTGALLRHIGKAETAEALFKQVRKDVLDATDKRQTPWEHSSLIEKFYFMPPSNEEIPDIVSF